MKRIFTFIGLLTCFLTSAQTIDDVLRYSSENLQGTARFQSMGGAFGALGGDFSALNVNPAGSAVFNNSLFTVTGTHYRIVTDSDFNGSLNSANSNSLDLNQIGGAFIFKSTDPDSDWNKIALAVNYDVSQNFDDRTFTSGTSSEGLDNYFLDFADGFRLEPLKVQEGEFIEDAYLDIGATEGLGFPAQQAFLGFQAGIIEPIADEPDNTQYFSNADYNTVGQDYRQDISGYNGKFTLNASTEYADRLYFGASMNFHNLLYDRLNRYSEEYVNSDSELRSVSFDNLLHTEGTGFSLSVGAIARLNEFIRIGGSYQSPTWYRMTDNFSQRITSSYPERNQDLNFIDFNQVNIFDYKMKTPGKLTASIAAVFGQQGLLSFDYGYQDMSNAELRPSNDAGFASENSYISETLGAVSSFRVGGEYRIKRISLRGGYRFEQSPYADGNLIGDLNGISAGIGVNFGGSRLDLALSRTERDVVQYFFDTGFNTPAVLNKVNTNVGLGYTLNF